MKGRAEDDDPPQTTDEIFYSTTRRVKPLVDRTKFFAYYPHSRFSRVPAERLPPQSGSKAIVARRRDVLHHENGT
jgi:hypothetical protein